MKSQLVALAGLVLGTTAAAQLPRPTMTRVPGVLPPATEISDFIVTADGRRTYALDRDGQLWLYEIATRRRMPVIRSDLWDLTVSPKGDALAYSKNGEGQGAQFVWLLPLDPRTGFAAGAPRRVSAIPGDVPAISPDGQWVAFARDDTSGIGQSLVVVPAAGGPERILAPFLPSGIGLIRWTPDSRAMYFGVNAPRVRRPDPGTIRRVSLDGGDVRTIAAVKAAWPGLSPDGRFIVYSDTGASLRMVVADTTGRRLYEFAPGPYRFDAGWLSGSTMMFSGGSVHRQLRSYSLADGRLRTLVDSVEQLWAPSWSPDGKTISVVYREDAASELWLLDPSGAKRKTIPVPEPHGSLNMWSPDSRWIAYRGNAAPGSRHVVGVEVATGKAVPLIGLEGTSNPFMVWRADSRAILVSTIYGSDDDRYTVVRQADLAGTVRDLKRIDSLGRDPGYGYPISSSVIALSRTSTGDLRLAPLNGGVESIALPALPGFSSIPVLSADEQWVAVRNSPHGRDNTQMNVIEVAKRDGTGRVTVTVPFYAAPGERTMQFLPGNRQLIVVENPAGNAYREMGVYLVSLADKSTKKLFAIPREQARPPEFSLSPDGHTIVFIDPQMVTPELFSVDIASLLKGRR